VDIKNAKNGAKMTKISAKEGTGTNLYRKIKVQG
jgi:hypothetical protein